MKRGVLDWVYLLNLWIYICSGVNDTAVALNPTMSSEVV